ncbi:hypothetical protein OG625_24400 [Streptomyces sp. NBC_01351]|uniref:hypothetical protein n=1 Tax=Streptomyces sp. NBC_01351 TaxID=2903833 RepID=UPI002E33D598|nr:hypothetical protein [Streptomyces sp. NBC_01351]
MIEPGMFGTASAQALSVEFDSLSEYKSMVDVLLDDLAGSHANDKKLADGTLPAGKLGTGFPEADALFKSYDTVITELQKLSKGLAAQIEALGIAILSANKGYGGVDEETKRRMATIAKEAKEQYVPERDPWLEEQRRLKATNQPPSTETPSSNGSTSGGDI